MTDNDRKALKAFMKAKGLTQKGWCELAGVNEQTLSKYMSGSTRFLSGEIVGRLARAADSSPTEMFGHGLNPSLTVPPPPSEGQDAGQGQREGNMVQEILDRLARLEIENARLRAELEKAKGKRK